MLYPTATTLQVKKKKKRKKKSKAQKWEVRFKPRSSEFISIASASELHCGSMHWLHLNYPMDTLQQVYLLIKTEATKRNTP